MADSNQCAMVGTNTVVALVQEFARQKLSLVKYTKSSKDRGQKPFEIVSEWDIW